VDVNKIIDFRTCLDCERILARNGLCVPTMVLRICAHPLFMHAF